MSTLRDDLQWYRRVFLPSLRLIWRHRPRRVPDLHTGRSVVGDRAGRAAVTGAALEAAAPPTVVR